jgi:Flp pilus assembly protein TadG
MITLYLGGVEVTQAVAVDRKTTLIAHTVADLIAQDTNVTNADMSNVLNASAAIVAPYSTTPLTVKVSCVSIDGSGKATVLWSDSLPAGSARTPGDPVTLPTALAVANSSLIFGEVSYAYRPLFGWVLTGTFNLYDKIYMRPRLTNTVTRSAT